MEKLAKRLEKKGLRISLNMSQFGDNKYFVSGKGFETLKQVREYYF